MCYTIYNSRTAVPILMIFIYLFIRFVSGPHNRINIKEFEKSQQQKIPEKSRSI